MQKSRKIASSTSSTPTRPVRRPSAAAAARRSSARSSASGWAAALILPGYFLADATITLVRRALRGRNVMRAHREHFYQRALDLGRSHATVCRRVILANAALVLVSWCLPVLRPEVAIAMAALVVAATLVWMVAPGNASRRSDGR